MDETQIFDMMRQALWISVQMSAPLLTVALVAGVVIGLFQALTSVQEMTLTFVPKVGLMLAVSRKICVSDRLLRTERGFSRESLMGHEIGGATLGLVGIGHTGREVAKLARGFDMRVLAYDTTSTASIAATLAAARESARRARETLSTSMWEALNTTYRAVPSGHFRSMRPPVAFRWVRDRAAQINGIAEATMTRDEGYQFLVLGRSIERADMTSRLVATAALTSGAAWGTSLRACGAYEAFLRTYRGLETERGAAEFLLLDRLFPRSITHSIRRAEQCLHDIEPRTDRLGVSDQAQRLLGQIRSDLEYRPIAEILDDLPRFMDAVQEATSATSEAVRQRYFPTNAAPSWVGENS